MGQRPMSRAARAGWIAMALALAACSREPAVPPAGLRFETERLDFGRIDAGPNLPVSFPFVNGPEEVRVLALETNCGCIEPELLVAGAAQALPARIPAGARGEVRATFRTAGYSGRKTTGLTLLGEGPGLPRVLVVDSLLDSWLTLEPEVLDFGALDGTAEASRTVRARGRGPFRMTELLGGSPLVRVEGLPSGVSAREQEFRVVVLPGAEEGRQAAFLNLGSDTGHTIRLPIVFEVRGALWTQPGSRLLLGEIPSDAPTRAAVEVGARTGRLEPPEAWLEGLEGAQAAVHSVQEGSRYRIDLTIPASLPPGAVSARLQLRLRHHLPDGVHESERKIRIYAVVRAGNPEQP